METKEKKKYKKYEKKEHPVISLNVVNYLAGIAGNTATTPSMRYYFVKYLNDHRDAEFKKYDDISKAIREEYGLEDPACNRTTVSKIVNSIQGELRFKDGVYYFAKVEGIYKLRSRISNSEECLQKLFEAKNMFRQENVHFIGKDNAVFAVNPSKIDEAKETFLKLLGPSCCFGVMAVDGYLVIMLNPADSNVDEARDLMRDFFKIKHKREALLEERKRREERREKQDKAIIDKRRRTKCRHFIK